MPQLDGIGTVGQVLDLMMPNVVSCAFHSLRVPLAGAHGPFPLSDDTTVAAISVTREQLDFGEWTIIGSQPVALAQKDWPNENCRSQRWIGAQMYDAAVAEDLLNALNGLLPWDGPDRLRQRAHRTSSLFHGRHADGAKRTDYDRDRHRPRLWRWRD